MSIWGRNVEVTPEIRAADEAHREASANVDAAHTAMVRAQEEYEAAVRIRGAAYHKLIVAVDAAEKAQGQS